MFECSKTKAVQCECVLRAVQWQCVSSVLYAVKQRHNCDIVPRLQFAILARLTGRRGLFQQYCKYTRDIHVVPTEHAE